MYFRVLIYMGIIHITFMGGFVEKSLEMGWVLWRRESRGRTSISAWMSVRNFPLSPEVTEFKAAFPATAECLWN